MVQCQPRGLRKPFSPRKRDKQTRSKFALKACLITVSSDKDLMTSSGIVSPEPNQPLQLADHQRYRRIIKSQSLSFRCIYRHHILRCRHSKTTRYRLINVSIQFLQSKQTTGDISSPLNVLMLRSHHPPRFQTHLTPRFDHRGSPSRTN